MTDREKVIKKLEKCKRYECDDCTEKGASQAPWDCPAYDNFVNNALALLKAQETTLEKDGHHIRCLNCGEYWCDNDREGNPFPINFCPNCGRKVKWE